MKRFVPLLLTLLLLLNLSACGGASSPAGEAETPANDSGKLKIVTTIFPIYDWVRQILGDDAVHAEVVTLLDSGVDLHSYQPTVDDIVKISGCDLFIYVGGESDAWVSDALRESSNPDRVVLSLLDLLGDDIKEEELVEGMEAEHEHEEAEEHDEEEDGPAYDEHVWLSLKNARVLCAAIADTLSGLDADCAEHYAANLAAYDASLASLDAEYAAMVSSAAHDTVLFGDRFPFRYLVDDYGLQYYAAFAGCSAETEASFETIVFLANKLDELGLPAVLIIDGSDGRIAGTIVENTQSKDQAILTLDSMQSATADGATYLSLMEQNLAVLTQALS